MSHAQGRQPSQAVPPAPIVPGYPNDPDVPDIYAEGVALNISFNAFSLIFNRIMRDPALPVPVAVVRVSPQQAAVMARLLRKSIRDFEAVAGKINIPTEVLKAIGLEGEE
jgi:hypothetical protein